MDVVNMLKKRLRITWDDKIEDERLAMMSRSATAILDDAAGEAIDYEADDYAFELLYACVLYIRNDAMAQFRTTYSPDLLKLATKYRAKRELRAGGDVGAD